MNSYYRVLIQELADYEKMPDGPKISAETLEEDGFGNETFFRCFVAELNKKVRINNDTNGFDCNVEKLQNVFLARRVLTVLLYLLHVGGEAGLHGGSLRSA